MFEGKQLKEIDSLEMTLAESKSLRTEKGELDNVPKDPEKLAKKKIFEIERAENDFAESGERRIKDIEASISLLSEGNQIKEEKTKIREKIADLLSKVRENGKKKMLIAALGMSIFASASAGNIEKAQATEIPKDSKIAGENKPGISGIKPEKSKKYTNTGKRFELLDKISRRIFMDKADKIREELAEHINSQEYFKKIKAEYKCDDEYAKKEQERRLSNLKTVKIRLLSSFDINKEGRKEKSNAPQNSNIAGFYDQRNHEVVVPYNGGFAVKKFSDNVIENIMRHELIHASQGKFASKNSEVILNDAYYKSKLVPGVRITDLDNYHMDTWERLARKKVLDREMENLGIKKYGEKFSKDHFKKMTEAYKARKFSHDAMEFIKRTKFKYEYFQEIFDNIAENEYKEPLDTV